eukprot:1855975-Pleurochrysis_carterae.AAC.1
MSIPSSASSIAFAPLGLVISANTHYCCKRSVDSLNDLLCVKQRASTPHPPWWTSLDCAIDDDIESRGTHQNEPGTKRLIFFGLPIWRSYRVKMRILWCHSGGIALTNFPWTSALLTEASSTSKQPKVKPGGFMTFTFNYILTKQTA